MNILQYNDLDTTKVRAAFDRTVGFLQAGDFRAADVKKLKGTPYYRAKLSDADRLLFRFGSYGGRTYLLLLETIFSRCANTSRRFAFRRAVPSRSARSRIGSRGTRTGQV